jgi:hypothetical protein
VYLSAALAALITHLILLLVGLSDGRCGLARMIPLEIVVEMECAYFLMFYEWICRARHGLEVAFG